jgi:7-carboxy-7-deazaguanine synthase
MERITDYEKVQPIVEAYVAVQSEGSRAGIPNFIIRTSGCTLRCQFGTGGFCDTWYTSWSPEKGTYTLNKIKELFLSYPQIKEVMITGGSPTMHPELVNEIIHLAKETRDMFITIETEGSRYIETDIPIDLVSLSPKFSNSRPIPGSITPDGKLVTEKHLALHEKNRCNYDAMAKMLSYHKDYHLKPVVDRNQPEVWDEIKQIQTVLNIPNEKVWIMPAGDSRESVIPNYAYVLEECPKRGYNFTGRAHIVAFDTKKMV